MRTKLLAVLAGSAIALTAASPAVAAPWDGSYFDFGLGKNWRFHNMHFLDVGLGSTSVDFTQPASNVDFANMWGTGLMIKVESATAGINDYYMCSGPNSNIDITTDSGDLVFNCEVDWDMPTNSAVKIRQNIRIFGPEGDLVRYTLEIQNTSNADITDFTAGSYSELVSGDIWDYQNYDATVLPAPAKENSSNAEKLNSVDSNWIVTHNFEGAPGSLAWGHNSAMVDSVLDNADSSYYSTTTDTFTVAAGETVYLAYFTGWDPANLNEIFFQDDEYANPGDEDLAAAAVADAAEEFDSFSGRLTRGLPSDANVINWAPAPDAEGLAPTGANDMSIWASLALLVAGVAGRVIRRRVRA